MRCGSLRGRRTAEEADVTELGGKIVGLSPRLSNKRLSGRLVCRCAVPVLGRGETVA